MSHCRRLLLPALAALLSAGTAATTLADSETYVNGAEGIKAASAPPAGFYWRSYNIWYRADSLQDPNGRDTGLDTKVNVLASANRFLWMTDAFKDYLWGADYGMHLIVPVVDTSVKIDQLNVHDNDRLRVGDLDVSPLILSWHQPRFDWVAAYEVYLPTSESGTMPFDEPAFPGRGYYTHMFTLGGTWYMDEAKSWSLSLLPRYEVHTCKDGMDYTPGDDFHFEWGLGKALNPGLEVGLAGYCQWQVNNDEGSDAGPLLTRDQVYAAGPEVVYAIKPLGVLTSLRVLREFAAEDRPEGWVSTLTLTKRF